MNVKESAARIAALESRLEEVQAEAKAWCQRVSDMNYQCESQVALGKWERCPDYGRCPHVASERRGKQP